MAKITTITIDETTGATEVDATGYHGKGCDAVVRGFTAGLGNAEVSKKSEFNAPEITKNKLQQRN